MALNQIELVAGLYIEADPDDPALAGLMEAVKKYATITVTSVNVVFKDSPLYQQLWDAVTNGGQEVRFVVLTGAQESTVVTIGTPEPPPSRNDAAIAMVTTRKSDQHVLFAQFTDKKALREFLRLFGIGNVPVLVSALGRLKSSGRLADLAQFGLEGNQTLWTRQGGFDLTLFVTLSESDVAGVFWEACDDVPTVGPMRIELLQELAVRLRQQQVVPLPSPE